MRIIAGTRRGLILSEFQCPDIRPTSDKVKGAVFNMLMNLMDITNTRVLDLYAGTGNLGLEALSRGALHACFVEKNSAAIEILKQNIRKARFIEQSEIKAVDSFNFLSSHPSLPFDLIFADPPYNEKQGNNLIISIVRNQFLAESGFFVFESGLDERVENIPLQIEKIKDRSFRDTRIRIYQHIRH